MCPNLVEGGIERLKEKQDGHYETPIFKTERVLDKTLFLHLIGYIYGKTLDPKLQDLGCLSLLVSLSELAIRYRLYGLAAEAAFYLNECITPLTVVRAWQECVRDPVLVARKEEIIRLAREQQQEDENEKGTEKAEKKEKQKKNEAENESDEESRFAQEFKEFGLDPILNSIVDAVVLNFDDVYNLPGWKDVEVELMDFEIRIKDRVQKKVEQLERNRTLLIQRVSSSEEEEEGEEENDQATPPSSPRNDSADLVPLSNPPSRFGLYLQSAEEGKDEKGEGKEKEESAEKGTEQEKEKENEENENYNKEEQPKKEGVKEATGKNAQEKEREEEEKEKEEGKEKEEEGKENAEEGKEKEEEGKEKESEHQEIEIGNEETVLEICSQVKAVFEKQQRQEIKSTTEEKEEEVSLKASTESIVGRTMPVPRRLPYKDKLHDISKRMAQYVNNPE